MGTLKVSVFQMVGPSGDCLAGPPTQNLVVGQTFTDCALLINSGQGPASGITLYVDLNNTEGDLTDDITVGIDEIPAETTVVGWTEDFIATSEPHYLAAQVSFSTSAALSPATSSTSAALSPATRSSNSRYY